MPKWRRRPAYPVDLSVYCWSVSRSFNLPSNFLAVLYHVIIPTGSRERLELRFLIHDNVSRCIKHPSHKSKVTIAICKKIRILYLNKLLVYWTVITLLHDFPSNYKSLGSSCGKLNYVCFISRKHDVNVYLDQSNKRVCNQTELKLRRSFQLPRKSIIKSKSRIENTVVLSVIFGNSDTTTFSLF